MFETPPQAQRCQRCSAVLSFPTRPRFFGFSFVAHVAKNNIGKGTQAPKADMWFGNFTFSRIALPVPVTLFCGWLKRSRLNMKLARRKKMQPLPLTNPVCFPGSSNLIKTRKITDWSHTRRLDEPGTSIASARIAGRSLSANPRKQRAYANLHTTRLNQARAAYTTPLSGPSHLGICN